MEKLVKESKNIQIVDPSLLLVNIAEKYIGEANENLAQIIGNQEAADEFMREKLNKITKIYLLNLTKEFHLVDC